MAAIKAGKPDGFDHLVNPAARIRACEVLQNPGKRYDWMRGMRVRASGSLKRMLGGGNASPRWKDPKLSPAVPD